MHILHQLSQKSVCVWLICFYFCIQLKISSRRKKKLTNPPLNFIQSEIRVLSPTFGSWGIKTLKSLLTSFEQSNAKEIAEWLLLLTTKLLLSGYVWKQQYKSSFLSNHHLFCFFSGWAMTWCIQIHYLTLS